MRLLLTSLSIFTLSTNFALAEEPAMTLGDKLNAKKEAFMETADQKKISEYEQGIIDVKNSGVLERAKNVGDTAPDFTLPDSTGENVKLSELLETGPVVMIWYRGEWCPYCNIYLEDIQNHADEFEKAGAHVIAISPETPEHAVSVTDKLSLGYTVLSDVKSKVAEEYGVVYTLPEKIAARYQDAFDLHGVNDDESNVLPLSASYVIKQDGTISFAYLNADYRERAETSLLLEEVKKLR